MEEHIPFEADVARGQQHLWIFVILLQLKKRRLSEASRFLREIEVPLFEKIEKLPTQGREKKERMQRNKNSKYQPDKPAFAGKMPFAKRMRRALGDSRSNVEEERERRRMRWFNIFLVAIISIAVLLSYNYTDEFNTHQCSIGTSSKMLFCT